jgi:hypothetical protein
LQVRLLKRTGAFEVDEELTDIGNGLNVVKVMPESAIKFGAYEVILFGLTSAGLVTDF